MSVKRNMPKNKPEETRGSRFKRIATKRTNDIIKKVSLLGNCSNRSSYDYSEQDINKIFNAIEKELKQSRARFTFNSNKTFKL